MSRFEYSLKWLVKTLLWVCALMLYNKYPTDWAFTIGAALIYLAAWLWQEQGVKLHDAFWMDKD